jgi:CubicO group peptidase (beta-lactamase class C family)
MQQPSDQTRRTLLASIPAGLLTSGVFSRAFAATIGTTALLPRQDMLASISAARDSIRQTMAAKGVPGASVALVQGQEPLWIEGFGVTDAGARPVDERTIFSIQSISKNFTAVAIMAGVQDGLLDLDRPITAYLPDFRVHSRFEEAPQTKMTLRLLLAHRAGFTHEASVGNGYDLSSPTFEQHVRSISETWLRYSVGERYSYSNLGIDLAGFILETVSGMPFANYLRRRLFEPLGMTDTTLDPAVYSRRENRAIGHSAGYVKVPVIVPLVPSGGVYTSARDMARWASFHLGRGTMQGRQVLRRNLWEEMHAFPYGGTYSLGVSKIDLNFEKGVVSVFAHDGGGFGFLSMLTYGLQTQIAWIVMLNTTGLEGTEVTPQQFSFPAAIMGQAYSAFGALVPAPKTAPPSATPVHVDYEGGYLGRDATLTLARDGEGFGFDWMGGRNKLLFTSPTEGWIVDGPSAGQKLRYHPARGAEPAYLEGPDGSTFDFNDGPHDPPGTIDGSFDDLVGDYHLLIWGKPSPMRVRKKNGYLYLDDFRLTEYAPRLFFTGDGEAVDFRPQTPTFHNVRLFRS